MSSSWRVVVILWHFKVGVSYFILILLRLYACYRIVHIFPWRYWLILGVVVTPGRFIFWHRVLFWSNSLVIRRTWRWVFFFTCWDFLAVSLLRYWLWLGILHFDIGTWFEFVVLILDSDFIVHKGEAGFIGKILHLFFEVGILFILLFSAEIISEHAHWVDGFIADFDTLHNYSGNHLDIIIYGWIIYI